MNHLKVERIFLFRFVLEIMFSDCHFLWGCGCGCGFGVGVCVSVSVCVDSFNMDVLVRVPGCVSLHFPPFYFSCFVLLFSRFVLVIFVNFFMI